MQPWEYRSDWACLHPTVSHPEEPNPPSLDHRLRRWDKRLTSLHSFRPNARETTGEFSTADMIIILRVRCRSSRSWPRVEKGGIGDDGNLDRRARSSVPLALKDGDQFRNDSLILIPSIVPAEISIPNLIGKWDETK
ncbi:hypothetical protein VTN00DRAFT_6659 [Thermoascus crustaceus]|uniref:uncharacterized protein n=1 Tax=Thermoascus crustaceus TaxID=5088 RepID=UPI00374326E1